MFEYPEKMIAIIFIDINSVQNKLKHSRVNLIETTTAITTTTRITTKMTTAVPTTISSTTPTTQMKTITSTTARTGTTATTDTTITIGTAITDATTVKTTTPLFNELDIPDITLLPTSSSTDEPMAKLGLENPTPTSDVLLLTSSCFCILSVTILLAFLLNYTIFE